MQLGPSTSQFLGCMSTPAIPMYTNISKPWRHRGVLSETGGFCRGLQHDLPHATVAEQQPAVLGNTAGTAQLTQSSNTPLYNCHRYSGLNTHCIHPNTAAALHKKQLHRRQQARLQICCAGHTPKQTVQKCPNQQFNKHTCQAPTRPLILTKQHPYTRCYD